MIKTDQNKRFLFQTADETAGEEILGIVELSEEDTDLVGGGPVVENDPPVN